jgi:hypothetical protein
MTYDEIEKVDPVISQSGFHE